MIALPPATSFFTRKVERSKLRVVKPVGNVGSVVVVLAAFTMVELNVELNPGGFRADGSCGSNRGFESVTTATLGKRPTPPGTTNWDWVTGRIMS